MTRGPCVYALNFSPEEHAFTWDERGSGIGSSDNQLKDKRLANGKGWRSHLTSASLSIDLWQEDCDIHGREDCVLAFQWEVHGLARMSPS